MTTIVHRTAALCLAVVVALAGCTGSDGENGSEGESGPDLSTREAAIETWREAMMDLDVERLTAILPDDVSEERRASARSEFSELEERGFEVVALDLEEPEEVSEDHWRVRFAQTVRIEGEEDVDPRRTVHLVRQEDEWRVSPWSPE